MNEKQKAETLWSQNKEQRVRKDRFDVAVGKKDYDAVFNKKLANETPDLPTTNGNKSIKKVKQGYSYNTDKLRKEIKN